MKKEIIIKRDVMAAFRASSGSRYAVDDEAPCIKALAAAIKEAEGRATVRTLTPSEVLAALVKLEDTLQISKKAMDGVSVSINVNSQRFPKSYKYTPQATIFCARFHSGTWRVYYICRDQCTDVWARVLHTDASKNAVVDRFTWL